MAIHNVHISAFKSHQKLLPDDIDYIQKNKREADLGQAIMYLVMKKNTWRLSKKQTTWIHLHFLPLYLNRSTGLRKKAPSNKSEASFSSQN